MVFFAIRLLLDCVLSVWVDSISVMNLVEVNVIRMQRLMRRSLFATAFIAWRNEGGVFKIDNVEFKSIRPLKTSYENLYLKPFSTIFSNHWITSGLKNMRFPSLSFTFKAASVRRLHSLSTEVWKMPKSSVLMVTGILFWGLSMGKNRKMGWFSYRFDSPIFRLEEGQHSMAMLAWHSCFIM